MHAPIFHSNKAIYLLCRVPAQRHALNAARATPQRGNDALARLRYADAAKRVAEAAAKVPAGHEHERLKHLNNKAPFRQGDEFGDDGSAQTSLMRNTIGSCRA
ncbi:MAG: hypothetical protein ACREDM_10450 [Methylocella sp.]